MERSFHVCLRAARDYPARSGITTTYGQFLVKISRCLPITYTERFIVTIRKHRSACQDVIIDEIFPMYPKYYVIIVIMGWIERELGYWLMRLTGTTAGRQKCC